MKALIIGAGMAGLAAATRLAAHGVKVSLREASPNAGGRCRSFFDPTLERAIDNGSHLLLGGNRSVGNYLREVGAASLVADRAAVDIVDLVDGRLVRLDERLAWSAFRSPLRAFSDALRPAWRILRADDRLRADQALRGCSRDSLRTLWHPLIEAVLNTPVDRASARLLRPLFTEILFRGSAARTPLFAPNGLSRALVDPALSFLGERDAEVRFGDRVVGLDLDSERVRSVEFSDRRESVGDDESVILATSSAEAKRLLPDVLSGLSSEYSPIVNVHYRCASESAARALLGDRRMLGLVGGSAHWLFRRGDVVSATTSCAWDLSSLSSSEIAERAWRDVVRLPWAERFSGSLPPYRTVKERRATLLQTPSEFCGRRGVSRARTNLWLAGDWTHAILPATVEAATRSGRAAASDVLAARR